MAEDTVSLREYFESKLYELGKRVDVAVDNIKQSTTAAFQASQKAIDKQEESQRTYNQGHNDITRKMDDQYKIMMPRIETMGLFKSMDEKSDRIQSSMEKNNDSILKEIAGLRESRSEAGGKGMRTTEIIGYLFGFLGLAIGAVSFFIK